MTPIVGRSPVVAALRTAVDGAIAAGSATTLLCGEPGIGKTTLAREIVDHAGSRGAISAWGTCWDNDGAPPFWPWHQVLRRLGVEPAVSQVSDGGSPDARFRLFTAVLDALVEPARVAPLVVVLDDLQWADAGSLRLFTFLARHLGPAPIMLVGTYRTVDPLPSPTLRATLADLAGVAATHEVAGLSAPEVAQLLAGTVGPVPADVVMQVHRRTGGNPFFVREVAATAQRGGVPPSVRAVLDRRLDRLPDAAVDLVTAAALIGTRVPLPLLTATLRVDPSSVESALTPAIDDGLLIREARSVRFQHDLVREVAAARVDPSRRPGLHGAIAAALRDTGASPAEIARHSVDALPTLPFDEVVRACAAAALAADAAMAYETATEWWRQAVAVAGPSATPDLRLDLANAAARSGEHDRARSVYLSVGRTATGPVLTRAALGLHELGTASESSHRDVIALLERAMRAADSGREAELARLGAALARELSGGVDADPPRAVSLADSAVRRARRLGDPAVLAFCLFAAHDVGWGPGTAASRLKLAEEMTTAAGDDPDLRFEALLCRFVALVDLGDPQFEVVLRDLDLHARTHRLPRQQFLVRSRQSMVADLRGDRAEGTRLRAEADALAAMIADPDRVSVWWTQLMMVALTDRGPAGVAELDDSADVPIAPQEFEPEMRAMHALRRDSPDEAAAILRACPSALDRARYRWRALAGVALSAEVALPARAVDLCADLYAAILPFTGEVVDIGGAAAVVGPADMYAGLLAATIGRPDDAERHLRAGADLARRLGAPSFVRRCEQAMSGAAKGVFRHDGPTWTLTFAGRTASVQDAKGLHDLATLLRSPGRDIPSTTLVSGTLVSGTLVSGATMAATGADPVLDDDARRAYRARLDALDRALDEAAASGGSVASLEAERDALIDELARASGLGGRDRRLGDPVERARTTVTARIRDALRRLDAAHPELAGHLRQTVTTGRTCAYRPGPGTRWEL